MSQHLSEPSKQPPPGYFGDAPIGQPTVAYNRGLIGHVPIVGWLLIVHAFLDGIFCGVSVFASIVMSQIPNQPNLPKEQLANTAVILVGWAVISVVGLFAHLVAGILMVLYRHRVTSIVALSIGFVTLFTIYCAPTTVLLAIYALIVLVNEPVIWAYQEIAKGTARHHVMMGQPVAIPAHITGPIS